MNMKLTAIGIATAAGLTFFGSIAAPAFAATEALTEPVAAVDERPRPGCTFRYDRPFPWLRLSIVDDASRVIGMPVPALCEALDHGRSLAQIASANGVSEPELKRGILAGQWADLMHQARTTPLTLAQAERYFAELVAHIDVIIHHHS